MTERRSALTNSVSRLKHCQNHAATSSRFVLNTCPPVRWKRLPSTVSHFTSPPVRLSAS